MKAKLTILLVAALGVSAAVGCRAEADDDADNQSSEVKRSSLSYVGEQVVRALEGAHGDHRGETWDVSTDNALGTGWLMATPKVRWGEPVSALSVGGRCSKDDGPACDRDFELLSCATQADCKLGGVCTPVRSTVKAPGAAPRSLCTGHSDELYETMYDLIASAKSFVDITTLTPPDIRFEAAIRNGITFLAKSGSRARVRFLYANIPLGGLLFDGRAPDEVLQSLTRDIDPASPMRVTVGRDRSGLQSWNHAKMVSVDGKVALVGGHNMWTRHYLDVSPVHDVSMLVRGSAAAHASRFANEMWAFACKNDGYFDSNFSDVSFRGDAGNGCNDAFEAPSARGPGTTPVIAVGRLGAIGSQDAAADDAILAMLRASRKSLRLSLQDIGPHKVGISLEPWPERYLRELVAAMGRGVDVHLVLTNLHAASPAARQAEYSNGWSAGDVVRRIAQTAKDNRDLLPPGSDVRELLCARLHVAPLRYSRDDAWPDRNLFANHAKFVMVDDRAFYVGSQNWYPSNLSEFGFIVDDVAAAATARSEYFDALWGASSRVAVSGAETDACALP